MDRIKRLCAYLDECGTFADVGCDHGYCTRYMFDHGLCKSAVISDISAKSLSKAEKLLAPHISCGECTSVCCNGLEKIDKDTDLVLIAGMGGEEIVNILKAAYIPKLFVFQPMHNAPKLREFLIGSGAEIILDEVFESAGKFYTVIKGKRDGGSRYSKAELQFGKNLRSAESRAYMGVELAKRRGYLSGNLSAETRAKIKEDIAFLEGMLSGEIE